MNFFKGYNINISKLGAWKKFSATSELIYKKNLQNTSLNYVCETRELIAKLVYRIIEV